MVRIVGREDEDLFEEKAGKRTRAARVHVTEGMLKLMQRIAEHDYLGVEEMRLVVGSRSFTYEYLAKLLCGGLVERLMTSTAPRYVFFLTMRGYGVLRGAGMWDTGERFLVEKFDIKRCRHTLACAAVRFSLERAGVVREWIIERYLDSGLSDPLRRCDAECKIGRLRFGVEVELTAKTPGRTTRILNRLGHREDLDYILWVTGDPVVSRSLQRASNRQYIEGISNKDQHLIIPYENVVPKGRLDGIRDLTGREVVLRSPSEHSSF